MSPHDNPGVREQLNLFAEGQVLQKHVLEALCPKIAEKIIPV
nr:hypothetical protein [Salinibacter altiplanensis]